MSFVVFLSHLFTKHKTNKNSILLEKNLPSQATITTFLYTNNKLFKKPTPLTLSHFKHTYYLNEGHRNKEFYMADSAHFVDLVKEIQNNPNCSFITQANKDIKSGQIPKQLQILKIDSVINDRPNLNQVACKIMNYFHIPTAYYIDCWNPILNKIDILTTNFIKDNEDLITFNIEENNQLQTSLENVLKAYDNVCENIYKDNPKPSDFIKQQKQNYEILTKMYLVRKWLITDDDFAFNNMGILYNKQNNTVTIAPAFDFEYSLESPISNICYDEYALSYRDLEFAHQYFPHILDDFISTSNNLLHKTLTQPTPLDKICQSSNTRIEDRNHFSRLIHKNFDVLSQHMEEIKSKDSEMTSR